MNHPNQVDVLQALKDIGSHQRDDAWMDALLRITPLSSQAWGGTVLSRAVGEWLNGTHPPAVHDAILQWAKELAATWPDGWPEVDDMLPLTALFAQFLRRFGPEGEATADRIEKTAREAWASKNPRKVFALWVGIAGIYDTPSPTAIQPPLWLQNLAWVVKKDRWEPTQERREKIPSPSAPAFLGRILAVAPVARHHPEPGGLSLSWGDEAWTAPAVLQIAAPELAHAPKAVPVVAAYLVRRGWERWVNGEDRWDYVPMPAARDEVERTLGVRLTEADIDAALDYLRDLTLAGHGLVAGVSTQRETTPRGGRPRKRRVVHLGAPLAPYGLKHVYDQAGMKLPAEWQWYTPVLPAEHTPLVGDRRTRERQRAAFAWGLPLALLDRRAEYFERGGVRLEDLRAPLRQWGLYRRTHASLLDRVLDALVRPPREGMLPLPGMGPRGPVLVPVAPGSGRYRLGPDYQGAHQLLLDAGRRTIAGLVRQRKTKGGSGRRKRRKRE